MSQSALFARLGAPLKNPRNSWGSVRADGTVFLRVWEDRIEMHDGVRFAMVLHPQTKGKPGHRDRVEHVALIRSGAPSYMIVCAARDADAENRRIKSYVADRVFPGGRIEDRDGAVWLELLAGVPVAGVVP